MPLGDEELRTDDGSGTPGPAAAPGVIEAVVLSEEPGVPTEDSRAAVPVIADAGAYPEVAHVPLWGPPSGGRAVARWQQAAPADGDGDGSSSTAIEPAPLAPAGGERRHRTPGLVGVALAGALLLAGLVALTAWPGTDTSRSLANQFGPGNPGPTDSDGRPVDLPPSQPATPVSFAPSGDVVRPEARRARVVDPRSGRDVMVDLPPGGTVDTTSGQVVVRVTGSPTTSIVRPTTTTTRAPTTTTTEDTTTTSTTEEPTTTTEEPTTTTETVPPTDPTVP